MMDANIAHQTVMLVRLGTPDTIESSIAGLSHARLDEQMAFIETQLKDCGLCRSTRISDYVLIGLFPTADSAFDVACNVQQACRDRGYDSAPVHVRILLDRLAGDFVDDAAPCLVGGVCGLTERLMKQVPLGQIFATRTISGHLSELSRARFRLYEQAAAVADTGEQLFQVICNEETITRIAIPTQYQERPTTRSLNLRWRDNSMTLVPESPSVSIGRGDQSDIQIKSELASRNHASLCFQQTNFILADQSTNGTFVQIDDDEEVYLHHEQIVLRSTGIISLGRRIRSGRGKLIYFKLTTREPV